MSFTIDLYTNTSPENFLTKSLTQIGTQLTGDLREGTSIIKPGIKVQAASIPAAANYLYIADFGRYYFIDDIETAEYGLYIIKARVDVLVTYATAIKACSGIVHRSENFYNTYLDDGSFRAYSDPYIITKEFPNGFTTQDFVLAVAGGTGSTS